MANKKSGLGKGLGQLFLENSVDELVANNTLPLEEIVPNKEQPRKTFDETALEELAESIRQHGVLQPLLVRPLPGGGYQLVVANIVADVILALAPMVRGLLRPQGTFICSGIISERAVEVADGLRLHGLAILESHESDGWMCFVCR